MKKRFNKKTEISSRPVKNDEQNKSVNTDSDKNRLKIDEGKNNCNAWRMCCKSRR